jgi:hypothetical protein
MVFIIGEYYGKPLINDENPTNSITQSTQQRGRRKDTKGHKGAKEQIMFQTPISCKKHIRKKKGKK